MTDSTEVAVQAESPPSGPAGSLLNFVALAVKDPTIDVAKLDALLRMQREIIADDAKAQFNSAFIRLQAKMPRIKKNGNLEYPVDPKNPNGPKKLISKFMKFEDIEGAIKPIMESEGFGHSFNTVSRQSDGGGLIVTHILRHTAGHTQETSLPVPLDTSGGKNNLQGYGSTLAYGKRYTMCAGLNIVAEGEDDDGVRAGLEFITDLQVKELSDLMMETGADLNAFCDTFGVHGLTELQPPAFAPAMNMLTARKTALKKKAQEPKA